jgi:uridylate kinase
MRLAVLAALSFFFASVPATTKAQTPIKDISAVFAEGKINGNEYNNDYFGLTLTPVNAQFTQGSFANSGGSRARLINAEANTKNFEDRYSIAILAAALSANPLVRSPEQYVRSVRHQFEQREGMSTVQEESAIEISGVRFVQATMKATEQGQTHYQGIYTTFLNGYILSIQVEAPTPERLQQIVLSMVKIKVSPR